MQTGHEVGDGEIAREVRELCTCKAVYNRFLTWLAPHDVRRARSEGARRQRDMVKEVVKYSRSTETAEF